MVPLSTPPASLQPPLTPLLPRPGLRRPEASRSWWSPGLLSLEPLMPVCTHARVSACVRVRVEFTAE